MIFQTERLHIRAMDINDKDPFYDLMSNPNVMNPIPQNTMDRRTSDKHFKKYFEAKSNSDTKVWAVDVKDGISFIGIAAFLKNDKKEDEIGYRLREKYWNLGYGSEIAKGLIDYGFNSKGMLVITADVNIKNEKSIKILNKFFKPDIEFYNFKDKCFDRRYKVTKDEWL